MRMPASPRYLPALLLVTALAACGHEAPFMNSRALDGSWTSPQLPYDIALNGMIGLAEDVRTKALQEGDPVLRLSAVEGPRLTARQWMPDGQWHSVVMERADDGTLQCTDGSQRWMLARKPLKAL